MTAQHQRPEPDDARTRVDELKDDVAARIASTREHVEQTKQRLARGVDRDGLDDDSM